MLGLEHHLMDSSHVVHLDSRSHSAAVDPRSHPALDPRSHPALDSHASFDETMLDQSLNVIDRALEPSQDGRLYPCLINPAYPSVQQQDQQFFDPHHHHHHAANQPDAQYTDPRLDHAQGWKFMSCSQCQELCQQVSWLLIGCTRVNNQSESRSAS